MKRVISNISYFNCFLWSVLIFLTACGQDTSEIQGDKKSENPKEEVKLTTADLRQASLDGHFQAVKHAVKGNVDINAADQNGRTPLMLASFNDHTVIVALLIEHQAEETAKDKFG